MEKEDSYEIIVQTVRDHAIACGRDPENILILTVSKQHSAQEILRIYQKGCRNFGENHIQEALEKISELPNDIQWHFIGNLQSNKILKAIKSFGLIHSIDNLELAKKVSESSQKLGITTRVLLEINTSNEASKHGLSCEDWLACLKEVDVLPNLQIEGLMTMAPFVQDEAVIRECFKKLKKLHGQFKNLLKKPALFTQLSMGMSNDYKIAIEEGATILRIGSAIFQPVHK